MGMFKWAEEESYGSPLFAAALGAGAVSAKPVANFLNEKLLIPSIRDINQSVVDAGGELSGEQVRALKDKLIDKSIRNKLLILQGGDPSFNPVSKKYLPKRKELEEAIRKGGLRTFEGKADPIKAIQAMRESGGFVKLPVKGANPIQLAHELGHATALNKSTSIRNTICWNVKKLIFKTGFNIRQFYFHLKRGNLLDCGTLTNTEELLNIIY